MWSKNSCAGLAEEESWRLCLSAAGVAGTEGEGDGDGEASADGGGAGGGEGGCSWSCLRSVVASLGAEDRDAMARIGG